MITKNAKMFIDYLNSKGIRFALTEHKDATIVERYDRLPPYNKRIRIVLEFWADNCATTVYGFDYIAGIHPGNRRNIYKEMDSAGNFDPNIAYKLHNESNTIYAQTGAPHLEYIDVRPDDILITEWALLESMKVVYPFLMKAKIMDIYNIPDKTTFKDIEIYAKQGNPGAQVILGMCYSFGGEYNLFTKDYIPQNLEIASDWFVKAVKQGDNDAQQILTDIGVSTIHPRH